MMNPLIARFADVPSLVAPMLRERFEAVLNAVAREPDAGKLMTAALSGEEFWFAADDWRAKYRPYVVKDGILQIPVKGVLLHDFPWAIGSWATGYIYIARALERGLADPNVRGIALICDTCGGEGAGCFELAEKIYAARGVKPIRAFAHETAYSAGYAIASAASRIVVSRTGGVGSIGVVITHVDVSRAMEEMGVKITFIFSGKHKVDGNAYEALTPEVKARLQFWCDDMYGLFCDAVARNRGMDVKAVRNTEAECFTAGEAVENGLADEVGPLDDAVAAFTNDPHAADEEEEGDETMTTATAAAAPFAAITSQAALDAILGPAKTEAHATGKAEGVKEGEKTGATSERTRISAILGSEEAKGRSTQAQHLAFETEMSADDAKKMLAKSAKESAAAPPDRLSEAMKDVKNPAVGADVGGSAEGGDDVAKASAAVSAYLGKKAA
jgi:signal peptide peptidase SppA